MITEIETIAPQADYDRWQQLLEERLSRLKTGSRDRNQAIYLTTDFLPGDFDYVFLLGLKEGNFPKRCKEDPILLDHERDTINSLAEATLQTAKDINLQQMESLNFSSACARKKWIGSFPAMDLISGDQEFSSFFLIDVIREMNEGVALDQQLYEDSLQKCRSDWIAKTPDMCLDYLDWSIHHLFSDPDVFINHILANNDGRLYFT